MEVLVKGRWGTWEELLLGGAVLRHGTRDWDVVASELQARIGCSNTYTPEICKAKYEDLQQRYSGCTAWFEELRKQRMAELRRALEVSEDSIGSLESKLEILKAERGDDCLINYDSSQTESVVPFQRSDGVKTSSKETSKDGLSAGSFTQETRTNWSSGCQVPVSLPTEEIKMKPVVSLSPGHKNASSIWKLGENACTVQGVIFRRRRGKRKRKDCCRDVKEGSVGESEFLGSADVLLATRCKENSTSSSGQIGRCFSVDQHGGSHKDGMTDLMVIFDSIAENKCATVFRRRLDSQKRGRYKKMILQHMDFDTIRSRIASQSITSTRELFRDLLLLANNALVFYSKTTREFKSARLLRELVTKSLREHLKDYISRTTIALLSTTLPILNPPVKPRSARTSKNNLSRKMGKAGNTVTTTPTLAKISSNAHSPPLAESLALAKKECAGPRKPGRGLAPQKLESPAKGRKRGRAK